MSYREENGQVVLTMSREDWQTLLITIGYAAGSMNSHGDLNSYRDTYALLNRLNVGNANYKPYEIADKPHPDVLCTCGRKYYEHRESGYKHAAVKLDHAFQAKP